MVQLKDYKRELMTELIRGGRGEKSRVRTLPASERRGVKVGEVDPGQDISHGMAWHGMAFDGVMS